MDFFSTPAFDVANELKIPAYYFYTSGAGALGFSLHFPYIHNKTTKNFSELNILFDIPGIPPIPSSDVPKPMQDRGDEVYKFVLQFCIKMAKSTGIIVNTFEFLEPRSVEVIGNGDCVPDGPTPPVYCIGPLIQTKNRKGIDTSEVPECITWLNSQPSKTVVFLCFGSLGLFSEKQLKEIANGLERSGARFLWVVRNPPPLETQTVSVETQTDPDLASLLPDGFLERTRDRGLVVKSWAPQVEVLNHEAVGGFVTHCGWNSVLEAVSAGVPMVAWPLYAEQRVNRVVLVEEIKIAVPMEEGEGGFVSSGEVEKRVREVMESEEGVVVRERITGMKIAAKDALSGGGSSYVALDGLVGSWKRK